MPSATVTSPTTPPSGLAMPILPAERSVNARRSPGIVVMPHGSAPAVGTANLVTTPVFSTRAMSLAPASVNQSSPSGPRTMPTGRLPAGSAMRTTAPAVVSPTSWSCEGSVAQTVPLAATASCGSAWVVDGGAGAAVAVASRTPRACAAPSVPTAETTARTALKVLVMREP